MVLINKLTRSKAINFNMLYLLGVCGVGVLGQGVITLILECVQFLAFSRIPLAYEHVHI